MTNAKGAMVSQDIESEDDNEDDNDNDNDWLFGPSLGFLEDENAQDTDEEEYSDFLTGTNGDLVAIMKRLSQHFSPLPTIQEFRGRTQAIEAYMGSMALCRGERGDLLREAGAVDALLFMLGCMKEKLPPVTTPTTTTEQLPVAPELSSLDAALLELAIACLGALRDLSCGNAWNRTAVRTYRYPEDNMFGLPLLASYLKGYHEIQWKMVLSSSALQLRLLTNLIGALRNITHSSRENCQGLQTLEVSTMLKWRLLCGDEDSNDGSLPDATKPWREACYRAAGTLVNLAEKCDECAVQFGSDRILVELLIEAWGGNAKKTTQTPILHLGLAAILHGAKKELEGALFDESWHDILAKEQDRRNIEQRKEKERKQRKIHIEASQ